MKLHWMGKDNPNCIIWIDMKIGSNWYVFEWMRNSGISFFRSQDATPPTSENNGRWFLRIPRVIFQRTNN